jgi:TfoX/Sxy family transcriptional regulator of competence genes
MEWKKAPEELVQFLAQKMKSVNCDYRKMFGYPAYFINGNMFAGIHGINLFIRLSESEVEEIMNANLNVTCFEPMPGRAMVGYVVIPKPVYSDDKLFSKWLDKSVKYASTLPQKRKNSESLTNRKN